MGMDRDFRGSACVRDRSSGYEEERLTKANGAGIARMVRR